MMKDEVLTPSQALMKLIQLSIPALKDSCLQMMGDQPFAFVLIAATEEEFQVFSSTLNHEVTVGLLKDAAEQLSEQLKANRH